MIDTLIKNDQQLAKLELELRNIYWNQISSEDQKRIDLIEDGLERILDLLEAIRIQGLDTSQIKTASVKELVENYENHLKIAELELAKKNPESKDLANKLIKSLSRSRLRFTSPEDVALMVEALSKEPLPVFENISQQIEESLIIKANHLQETLDLLTIISPELELTKIEIGACFDQKTHVAATNDLSSSLLTLKLINQLATGKQTITSSEFNHLSQLVQIKYDAQGLKVNFEDQIGALEKINNIKMFDSSDPSEIATRIFLIRSGLSSLEAKDVAVQLQKMEVPKIAASIASNSYRPNSSIEEKRTINNKVYQFTFESAMEYLGVNARYQVTNYNWQYLVRFNTQQNNENYFNSTPTRDKTSNPFVSFLINKGKNWGEKKIWESFVKSATGKALGLGAKAATTTAVEAGAITTGVTAAPATGGLSLLLAVAPFIAEISKNILSWIKRNFKKVAIAVGATIGLLIAGPIGAVMGALGGFVLTSPIVSLSSAANSVGTGISYISTMFVGLVATEIVWPIVVIAISIPIGITLILFIITNSAMVVPYGSDVYAAGNPAFSSVVGTCPLENGVISCGSYGTYTDACHEGHGGNHYWTGQSSACLYSIPIGTSCKYNNNHPESKCFNVSSTCSTYGFATDVVSPAGSPVYLPILNGKELDWEFVAQYNMVSGQTDTSGGGNKNLGFGRVYSSNDGINSYQIYLGHMESITGQSTLKSKQLVGKLACLNGQFSCSSSHVHIELKINGINVVPDGLCKK